MANSNGRSTSTEGPHPQSTIEEDTSLETRLQEGRPGMIVPGPKLMETDLPPLQFAVPKLFPHGVNLLAGPPKTGKSLFCLNLALSIANGQEALGEIPCNQGDVLYMALEDGPRRKKERLEKMGASQVPDSLEFSFDWEKFGEGDENSDSEGLLRDVLAGKQRAGKDYKLIVIDTFAKLRERANAGANAYYEDYEALDAFRDLAYSLDAAVMVVHHTNKLGPGADPYMRVSGTTGITANVDTVAVLERQRIENTAELQITGRDIEGQELGMSFNPDDLSWSVEGLSSTHRMGDTRQTIYDALKDAGGPKGPSWVSERVDVKDDTVRKEMGRMVDAEQLAKVGRGQYQVKEPDLF